MSRQVGRLLLRGLISHDLVPQAARNADADDVNVASEFHRGGIVETTFASHKGRGVLCVNAIDV